MNPHDQRIAPSPLPFVHGYIRIATEADDERGFRTLPRFEILARHHQAPDPQANTPCATVPPRQPHPIRERLDTEGTGLAEIPIRIPMDQPGDALRCAYQAFSAEGHRPACSGNGCKAVEIREQGGALERVEIACAGPEHCPKVASGAVSCRRMVRLSVQIAGQDDPLSVFELRSGSYHTHQALSAQLHYLFHRFGGLRHLPLKLVTWAMSSAASDYRSFHAVRLVLDGVSESEAMARRNQEREAWGEADDPYGKLLASAAAGEPPADEWDVVEVFYEQPLSRPAPRDPVSVARGGRASQASGVSGLVAAMVEAAGRVDKTRSVCPEQGAATTPMS